MKFFLIFLLISVSACSPEPAQALVLNDENHLVPSDELTKQQVEPVEKINLATEPKSQPKSGDTVDTPKININTATGAELESLPGVGPALAKRILDYREKRAFKRVQDIRRIKGIGSAKFKKLKPLISVKSIP